MDPKSELLKLPKGYGKPKKKLPWETVSELLENAPNYWVASTRQDGRPHAVPRDGIWLEDSLYYGGAPDTVHQRNVAKNPAVVAHIGDGATVVIVEGEAVLVKPSEDLAQKLVEASNRKYPGYGTGAVNYSDGVWAIQPKRVIAWTSYPDDATRFLFDHEPRA